MTRHKVDEYGNTVHCETCGLHPANREIETTESDGSGAKDVCFECYEVIMLLRHIGERGTIVDARDLWEKAMDLVDEGYAARGERHLFTLTDDGKRMAREGTAR